MAHGIPARELKKGSAELLILSLVEDQPRHGYDIGKLIQLRSKGALRFNVASLYPCCTASKNGAGFEGRWMEKPNQRRRRLYRLTPEGRKVLAAQRGGWQAFARAVSRIAGVEI